VTDAGTHRAVGGDPGRPSALARLTALPPRAFADGYWDRQPLLTRREQLAQSFDALLTAEAVDELVSQRGLRTPFVRMAHNGEVIAGGRFTRSGGAGAGIDDQVADDRVLGLMSDGATLVLQALHRTWPPLISFGSQLSAELGHPVQINAYVTPPQNRGFAAHYDVHDVFVLQIAGRKHWHLHPPVFVDPLAHQPWDQRKAEVSARAQQPPLLDTVLQPGDSLYLPRGFIHSATALGETSIHLTVGIHPRNRAHLVEYLMDAARHDQALRSSLPLALDLTDAAVLAPYLRDTVAQLHRVLDQIPAEEIAARFAAGLMDDTRPEPIAPLAQLIAVDRLDPSTRLVLRAGVRWRVRRNETSIMIRLLDKTVTMPIACEPAIKTALAGQVFTPAELAGLDADEQLVLARRLLREGVVVPA
jgi:bifunctional lysine-specific demethylase and histidyl-hydroxylase NO66